MSVEAGLERFWWIVQTSFELLVRGEDDRRAGTS